MVPRGEIPQSEDRRDLGWPRSFGAMANRARGEVARARGVRCLGLDKLMRCQGIQSLGVDGAYRDGETAG